MTMNEDLSRRKFLKRSIAAGTVVGGAALVGAGAYNLMATNDVDDLLGPYPPDAKKYPLKVVDPSAPKPNIIIIYCDDLGYGDLGCYGNTVIRTPNIDRLAETGTRFTDYYSCNAICAPSRAGLLTGRYPIRTGIFGNTYPKDEPTFKTVARNIGGALQGLGISDLRENYVARGISASEITMAEALKVAGYRTGMIGKWHLGDYSRQPEFNPLRHGFDRYFGVPYSNDMSPLCLFRNTTMLEADIGQNENQAKLTGLYTDEALQFIEDSKDEHFFLYLAHSFPHQPLFASEKFDKKSRAGKFGDAVEEIDWSLGQIVECLEKNGLDQNTLLVFTSDNGPWFEGNPGSFRGRKGQSYEGGFRVPLIVKWPSQIPEQRVSHVPITNIDFFPTFLALAGVEEPKDRTIDGMDILKVLKGEETESPHDALYFYHFDLLEGVRAGKWKYFDKLNRYTWPVPIDTAYVPNTLGKNQLGNRWPLLYNLEIDPAESYNVINTHPEVARSLRHKLQAWDKAMSSNPRGF